MTVHFRHLASELNAPDPAMIAVLAPWVVAASRPFADWYFGEPDVAAEIVEEWMGRSTSEIFAGRAMVYEDGDGPRACIIALSGSDLARCRAADFAVFCAEIGSEPEADAVIAEVLAASQELFPPVAEHDLYISRVAVDPASRGHGIGRTLVTHAIEAFCDAGLRTCRLDVSADNRAAIRAYEAAGLHVASTQHSPITGLTYCAMTAAIS